MFFEASRIFMTGRKGMLGPFRSETNNWSRSVPGLRNP
uniref:Uncharacterized protein n=1 Tax=Setaria viridis TaxID=4556 RepID=A0A4U6T031_SETVI|nr:hypothetical protein SEVIR_9G280500v2 [Setaria viridis]TKV94241.1 hypothetical protein SEVIR_9G280900v2 [Setaria viridis]